MDEEPTVDQETPKPRIVLPRRRRRSSLPSWTPMAILGGVALLGFATGGLVVAPQIAGPSTAPKPAALAATLSMADSAASGGKALQSSAKEKQKAKAAAREKGLSKDKAKGKDKEKEKEKGKKGKGKDVEMTYVELDNMIVNPAGSEGQHFLMVTVSLGLKDNKLVPRIENNKIALQDAIASTLSACTMEWLTCPSARDSLKVILAARVAEVTGISEEMTVFLPQFVMQ
jgi:flagellar basal body-associated protein FliL